jgi:hypothetical protein
MSTNDKFQRITDCLIKPLERHYGFHFDPETIGEYIDDFSDYSEETLKKAMRDIRHESKKRPTVAHILEKCRAHAGFKKETSAIGYFYKKDEEKRQKSWDYAFSFMNTKLGQDAKNGRYHTQMFGYVFEQMHKADDHVTSIPSELIQQWKLLGEYILKAEKNSSEVSIGSEKKSKWSNGINAFLDKYLAAA